VNFDSSRRFVYQHIGGNRCGRNCRSPTLKRKHVNNTSCGCEYQGTADSLEGSLRVFLTVGIRPKKSRTIIVTSEMWRSLKYIVTRPDKCAKTKHKKLVLLHEPVPCHIESTATAAYLSVSTTASKRSVLLQKQSSYRSECYSQRTRQTMRLVQVCLLPRTFLSRRL